MLCKGRGGLCRAGPLLSSVPHILFSSSSPSTTTTSSAPRSATDLRESFQSYFEREAHHRLPSAPLVPENDPSLLFTAAGMVPFKQWFLNPHTAPYPRVTTAQKCLRAGGKHNDLDNVGVTARHHTFFEMLGNFSFGDYFKEEAIVLAWNYVTKVLLLPQSQLRVTVYEGDEESARLWRQLTSWPEERIARLSMRDNFWSAGTAGGPCGPCTEIFWDQGFEDSDGERWLEVWNLVLITFRTALTGEGPLVPLARPCIDTGMGLERLCTVMQGVCSNYDTDLFRPLLETITQQAQHSSAKKLQLGPWSQAGSWGRDQSPEATACKVLADHARAIAFAVSDGVIPGQRGRGYVLRRLVRRALVHAHALGLLGPKRNTPVLSALLPAVQQSLGDAYPQLLQQGEAIALLMDNEEELFRVVLERGLGTLQGMVEQAGRHSQRSQQPPVLPAADAFKLHRAYGLPIDLTTLLLAAQNVQVDVEGFGALLRAQREASRAAREQEQAAVRPPPEWSVSAHTAASTCSALADGEQGLTQERATVLAVAPLSGVEGEQEEEGEDATESAAQAWVLLDQCPFYPEGGGQVGDQGWLEMLAEGDKAKAVERLRVLDAVRVKAAGAGGEETQQPEAGMAGGRVALRVLLGPHRALQTGAVVRAVVDRRRRAGCATHHTATHLLHAALRATLGGAGGQQHAALLQAGSWVGPDRLRLDFSGTNSALTPQQLQEVESWVNEAAKANAHVQVCTMSKKEAEQSGALALFGEKYPPAVRVVHVPGYSTELCGGTHLSSTGPIWPFKITKQEAVGAGTRRIEAKAGPAAVEYLEQVCAEMEALAQSLQAPVWEVREEVARLHKKLAQFKQENKSLQKALDQQVFQQTSQQGHNACADSSQKSGKAGEAAAAAAERRVHSQWGATVVHVVPAHRAQDVRAMRAQGDALREHRIDCVADTVHNREVAHVLVATETRLCLIICSNCSAQPSALSFLQELQTHFPGSKGGGQRHLAQLKIPSQEKDHEKGKLHLVEQITRALESSGLK
eukprot:g17076.t1